LQIFSPEVTLIRDQGWTNGGAYYPNSPLYFNFVIYCSETTKVVFLDLSNLLQKKLVNIFANSTQSCGF